MGHGSEWLKRGSTDVDVFYLQIVGRGNDQVAMTTKFETRDDMCRFSKCNRMFSRSPVKLRAQIESYDT